jgi:tyrosyl-tRNA synthetase
MKVNTDPKAIDEFLDRGPVEIFTREELKKKMMSGKKLRAYIGYDVTGPDLHLGNGSTMMKLRDWQELGHHTILVIGDYTTRVGDHSDKLEKRKRLPVEEIEKNKKKFIEQFGRIVDLDSAEIRYNSEWLEPLTFNDVINLASLFSVQQMIERENFAIRLKEKKTIGLEELLYPLMQGYDSVALKVDLEMGGTDQTFNLLAGRKIMEAYGMAPQNVITMPLIPGTDGRKMSKSWGNFIPMLASANDLYGGLMSCCDEVTIEYFKLLTRIPLKEIDEMEKELKAGKADPMKLKKRLALEVTKIYYDEKEAQKAQEHFEKTIQKGEVPDKIKEVEITLKESRNSDEFHSSEWSTRPDKLEAHGDIEALDLVLMLSEKGCFSSHSEAKRLIKQGGFKIDDNRITELHQKVKIKDGSIVKIGKRRYFKIRIHS